MMKMKIFLIIIFFWPVVTIYGQQSDELDYVMYHEGVIQSEEMIFLEQDSIGGLLYADSLFKEYPFVFVDDCIEFFQLAILYKQEDLAMSFLKKALSNGFQIEFLKYLSCNCLLCQRGGSTKVKIFDSFVSKHKTDLLEYQAQVFPEYLKRIDKRLLQKLLSRHITEQTYKNKALDLGISIEESKKRYFETNKQNLLVIKSLFQQGIYMGERNLGVLNNKLLAGLGIRYMKNSRYLVDSILQKVGLPIDTYVPNSKEYDYFEMSPLYIIFFHNPSSYDMLLPYKDEMIKKGFLHPREFASLKRKLNGKKNILINVRDLKLRWFDKALKDTTEINALRASYLLPPYEVDYKKYQLARKECLMLNFGMFYGTR